MVNNILVIDDEQEFLSSVRKALVAAGFKKMTLVNDPGTVADLLNREAAFDVAVIDITMPVMNGVEVLSLIKRVSPFTECIMITARDEARIAVDCLKKGAYDYLVKPIGADDFIRVIHHALERKRLLDIVELSKNQIHAKPANHAAFGSIITRSPKMYTIMRETQLHAISQMPVLISGETGTGKELLARAIHGASPRAEGPFTPINMASLSENLFESAFFGHAKGAFTGAQSEHMGFLEVTDGGTLFLDEIGTLPIGLQGKLLRVLQEKEFIKLGTNKPRSADVRFVAATNVDLHPLMADGLFRKDIYYRLRGAQLHLPSLRDRKEDIPVLIGHFLGELCAMREPPDVTEDAMSMLMAYDYPGNIRELKAMVQAALNLSQGGSITIKTLPADISRQNKPGARGIQDKNLSMTPMVSLAEMEKEHIRRALKETGGNLTHSARLLGICLNTLRRKLHTYDIGRK
jgi:DNA-binding NtrC family response regulator